MALVARMCLAMVPSPGVPVPVAVGLFCLAGVLPGVPHLCTAVW